ncbi:MAG: glycosyltransferase family A protein [bacterium]|jgi:glycosyltransferase involved in cell wall biosynthesis|nr:glycosyltransferase family 2 protein [candidate division KSB1 bacterium]MDH7558843.1 glycosyltransferase family A protein [bacterium]
MAEELEISVVVPTFNQAHTLRRVLAALAGQMGPGREVLVVDDGSQDQTEEFVSALLRKGELPGRYICQENKGAAATRNAGLSHARGQVVIFLDGDVIPAPGLVAAHQQFHREHPCLAHLALGVVEMAAELAHTGQVRQHETRLPFSCQAPIAIPWHYARGSNFSAKREFLMHACGFDTGMRSAAEDTELAFRLRQRGARLFFLPQAVAIHYHPMADEASYLRKASGYGASLARWYGHAPEARTFITAHYGLQTPYSSTKATLRHLLHAAVFNGLTESMWLRLARLAVSHWHRGADLLRRQVYKARYRRVFAQCLQANSAGPAASAARQGHGILRVVSCVQMRSLCRVQS